MKTLVLVEHDNASVKDATLATVGAAAKLGDVHLLVAGKGCAGVADAAAKIAGVGKVHLADDAAYEHQLPENVAPLVAGLLARLLAREDGVAVEQVVQQLAASAGDRSNAPRAMRHRYGLVGMDLRIDPNTFAGRTTPQ